MMEISESTELSGNGALLEKALSDSMEKINASMISHARQVAEEIGANAVLVYVDLIKSRKNLEALLKESHCILAVRENHVLDELKTLGGDDDRIIQVPYMKLSRHSQVKVAAMIALNQGLIHRSDRIVCLSGSPKYGILDNLSVLDLAREFEMFSSGSLDVADQIVINPFTAIPEAERNILDSTLKETIREFATIDGAFVIRDDGVILAAGRHLGPSVETSELPQGLGARHRSAAGTTALTNAIAVVISESTGDVRIFSRGKLFMEIEKAKRETI